MTFSIVARCPETGMFGIAITSSSPAVAARCAHAKAGIGVAASQNITDPALGQRALALMERGFSAVEARAALIENYPTAPWRQFALVDRQGGTAAFSGAQTLGLNAMREGDGAVTAGNLLANRDVPAAMMDAFEHATGHFAGRLLAALKGGLAAGGEAGPIHSAGLLIVREVSWPVVDLRIDWAETDPIGALEALWTLYRPQLEDYVIRAVDPTRAPSYGVPGDL